MNIKCEKSNESAIRFGDLQDKEWFYSGGALYIKIFSQDLKAYNIDCVNAVSLVNAGLTHFDNSELVNRAERTISK